jgi:basic membrane protein A and related proteins
MKRWLLLVVLVLATPLLATGGNAAPTVEPRVGFVAEPGATPSPRTLAGLPLWGFLRAEKELPIRGTVRYLGPTQGPAAIMTAFARQRYALVVAPLFEGRPIDSVARRFPHVRFLAIDTQPGLPPRKHAKNIHRAVFRAEQSGYLAGYLAALMARRGRSHTISAVAGFDFYGVTRWIVGYRAGAKKAVPGVTVRVGYSNDFANPAKCRRVALGQIAAGSSVVFNVAGACGLGALRAAKEKHVWGIGVDIDQSYLGPHILTSAIARLDRGVFDAIRRLVQRKLPPGATIVYDVRNRGVELGRISPKVPKSFLRKLETIRRQIADGTIRVPRPPG